jgi:hypothetical protein
MESFGFNWQRKQVYQPEWINDMVFLRGALILSVLLFLFYVCKNFKITHTKYIRGRSVSFV